MRAAHARGERVGRPPALTAFQVREAHKMLERGESASPVTRISMLTATANGLTKIGEAFLGKNAHSVAIDRRTHRVYFPVLGDSGPKMLVIQPR